MVYKCVDQHGKIYISQHVQFDECVFPHVDRFDLSTVSPINSSTNNDSICTLPLVLAPHVVVSSALPESPFLLPTITFIRAPTLCFHQSHLILLTTRCLLVLQQVLHNMILIHLILETPILWLLGVRKTFSNLKHMLQLLGQWNPPTFMKLSLSHHGKMLSLMNHKL